MHIDSLYFGRQELPEGYYCERISGGVPNIYYIYPPPHGNEWAAGLTLATSNKNNFNPFYWSRVFAGEEEDPTYFKKPEEFLRKVYARGHRIPVEIKAQPMIYIEGTKALFFELWRASNAISEVSTGGLGLSLRRTPGTGKCILGGQYEQYFRQADEFMREKAGRGFNAYEDFRRLLPYGYLTYGAFEHNDIFMGKLANFLFHSPVREFKEFGGSIKEFIKRRGSEVKDFPNVGPVGYGNLTGIEPAESLGNDKYRIRASLVILHQFARNRLAHLGNILITPHVLPSPSITRDEEIYAEFNELLGESLVLRKFFEKEETRPYSLLVGQVSEADIAFVSNHSLEDFLRVRDCNKAQPEAQSIGWAIRMLRREEGKKTRIGCIDCTEFSHKKNPEKARKKCMSTRQKNGRELNDFYRQMLGSF